MHHKIPSTLITLTLLCLLILAALWFAVAQAQSPLANDSPPIASPNPVATQAHVEEALQSARALRVGDGRVKSFGEFFQLFYSLSQN